MAAALALTACAGGNHPSPNLNTVAAAPPAAQAPARPTAPASTSQGPVKVGLLLPLSGREANLGLEMRDAAELALFDLGDDHFTLLFRDTKGSPPDAADAARKLIADGAKLILGPLLAVEVDAAAPVAHAAGVNLLAFSNDWQRAGNGTYILGFVPADQVARIVGYAHMRGLARIAVLAPRNPYGDAVIAALRDSAQSQGITVVREERYSADNSDLAGAISRLGVANASSAAVPAAGPTGTPAPAAGQGGFQALLIADGPERLKAMAPLLVANHLDSPRVRLLGTVLWDVPAVAALPGFAGAWYAAPAPQGRADFEGRFQGLYHHQPARLATLAYDATALAAVLARLPSANAFDALSLTNPSGFAGSDGIFRLRGDGLVERGLAVVEVGPEGARVIDQAPTSFQAVSSASPPAAATGPVAGPAAH